MTYLYGYFTRLLAAGRSEEGQTMAEYSVVLTLVILVFGIGAFVVLALAIAGEFDRITGILG